MMNPRDMMPVSSSSSENEEEDDDEDEDDNQDESFKYGDEPQRKRKLDQQEQDSLSHDDNGSTSGDEDDFDGTDSDAGSEDDDEDNNEDEDNDPESHSLSLQERLLRQEAKQSTMSTTTALKDQRERRNKARPLAKERLQEFRRKKSQQQRPNATDKDQQQLATNHKRSKHAPTEVSSRRSHNKTLNERGIGVTIGANRYQPRDPRMSNLSGHLNQDEFEHHYGFLEEAQTKEIAEIKRKLKAFKTTGKKGQRTRHKLGLTNGNTTIESLQEQLATLQQTVAQQNQQRLERNAKKAVKQKLQSQVATGQGGVYFPKRRELKKMQMEAKIEEIQKQKGKKGLDQYLAKRRKKEKSRGAKRMRQIEP